MTIEVTMDDLLGLGLSPKTAYVYARVIGRVETELGRAGTDLACCTGAELARVVTDWPASRSSRAQVRSAVLRAWELMDRDGPQRALRLPPKPKMRCRAIDPYAARRLEEAARARRDDPGLAVLAGLYAGLRRAEIAALRWDRLELDDTGRPAWMRVTGKGDVTADIPVHPVLAEALAAQARRTGWTFPARAGRSGHVHPTTVWTWVRQVGADAGVDVRPHLLRHTMLATANDASGDLRAVQQIARHSRPETTAGYTRTTSARMRAVVEMIDYRSDVA